MSFDYLMGYIMSISMCMQNFITIFHSVQEIGTFSLFQNLEFGKASTNENVISQSLGLDLANINVHAKVYQNIPLSSRERAIFTFSELEPRHGLGQSQTAFDIFWATSCQYQCVCKILSKYSKRFKSYRHFSRTGRWQNLHKQVGDKIKCLIIGHSMKVNLQFQLTFLWSCNCYRSENKAYPDPSFRMCDAITFRSFPITQKIWDLS